ncbi:hypothetical protein JNW90_19645 [Micromonospora sp. STR1s_5]|nr:hypothetical protein [Micromonospora sp. STR1s_5]
MSQHTCGRPRRNRKYVLISRWLVLGPHLLVTVRYTRLPSFDAVVEQIRADEALASSIGVFTALLEANVDRGADVLERLGAELDQISRSVFGMHALKEHPDLTYVMAMQESLVIAMAAGFEPGVEPARRLQRPRGARARERDGLALQREFHGHPDDPHGRPAGAGPRVDGAAAVRPARAHRRAAGEVGHRGDAARRPAANRPAGRLVLHAFRRVLPARNGLTGRFRER